MEKISSASIAELRERRGTTSPTAGHPVVGERLDAVQAHYRNSKGDAFMVQVDFRSAYMLRLYQGLELLQHVS